MRDTGMCGSQLRASESISAFIWLERVSPAILPSSATPNRITPPRELAKAVMSRSIFVEYLYLNSTLRPSPSPISSCTSSGFICPPLNLLYINSIADEPDKGLSGCFDFIGDLNRILLDSVIPLQ